MKKFLALIIALSLVSCVSTSNINLAKDNDKVHLFYHYVNPKYPYEAIALLIGKFEIENNCLYWISNAGEKSTPVFPEYPKDVVKLDVKSNTLIYANHKIKIGKMFEVNGAISNYKAGSVGDRYYEEQGHTECLAPTLAMIGTSFDEIE